MVTSVLVGYVEERERERHRERQREGGAQGIPCFLSADHTPRDLSRKCFLNYTCLHTHNLFFSSIKIHVTIRLSLIPKNPKRPLLLLNLGNLNRYKWSRTMSDQRGSS